ncbi:hypothetical protein ACOMHN_060205 [Nucella lapillus]
MESGGSSGQYPRPSQPQQGAPYADPVNSNPHLPQPKAPRLSKEEISILEECNSESFWYRCVPFGVTLGGVTTYLVKAGHLKPHPRYGATLKALGAVFLGYVMGKISYQGTCQQKILEKIPHTNLAQSVRKSKGIASVYEQQPLTESAEPGAGYRETKMRESYSSMDSASDQLTAPVKELDDNFRPSLDREVAVKSQEEAIPEQQRTLTYEELRQQNRLEYERNVGTSPSSPLRQRPFPVPRPGGPFSNEPSASSSSSSSSPPAPSSSPSSGSPAMWDTPQPQSPGRAFDRGGQQKNQYGQQKNQYGDMWDKN